MKLTRRSFIKGAAAAGTVVVAADTFLFNKLDTLKPLMAAENQKEAWVPTTCWVGKQDCGILARIVNGRLVKLVGNPSHPRNRGTLCPKGTAQIFAMYDPNRVKTPLIRTNEKGVHGKFKPATWNEALKIVATKMNEVRAKGARIGKDKKDNPFLLWQKGRSKAKSFYDKAFVGTTGAVKLHHGSYCSDAGYRACEYTIGPHGVLHPDFRHTKYLLSWGWNITNAGGNKFCWITWPQQMLDAKEKGLKITHIDPRLRSAGPHADTWVPIKPGTDLPLALSLCHELIRRNTIDREYLKNHTNIPYLVAKDGHILKINGKEQVWDTKTNRMKPHDAVDLEIALEGQFVVNGTIYQTGFEIFKKHVQTYSPAFAAKICDIPEKMISKIAAELSENANIGSTITIDKKVLPYRPVAIMAYHMAQQELGFQTIRSMLMIPMLLGSMGAVGGQMIDFSWKIHKNFKGLGNIKIKDNPNIYLKNSKFFPINSNNTGIVAKVVQNPKKYGVKHLPEMAILHMVNPLVAFPSIKDIKALFDTLKFVVVIDPWLSETADMYADVVLPAATLEKHEGPISAGDQYDEAYTMRLPVSKPLYDSKGEIDIYLDLCQAAGILYGKNGYIAQINKNLKLKTPYTLPLDKRPTPRDILDRWSKQKGIRGGISYFEKHGVFSVGPTKATKKYGYATNPMFGGVKHRLYGDSLLTLQEQMKKRGVEKIYWRDYTALPEWRNLQLDQSPQEYDLYLISYKMVEYKQSRSSFIPLVSELAPKQHVYLNTQTAKKKQIKEGDFVWVESHNSVTGETRRVKVMICVTEGLRPDVIAMPHHYGMWTHPWSKGQGPSPNSLFFTGEGYVTNTADQTFHVKTRIIKV